MAEREKALAELARKEAENTALRAEVRRLTTMVERLTRQLDQLLAKLGEAPRKPGSGTPETGADGEPVQAAGTSGHTSPRPPPRRHAHGRGGIPEELPRDTQVVPPPDRCPYCGEPDPPVADQVESEQYHFVRAHVRVRRIVRKVGRCRRCGRRLTPPLPPMPFERASCTFEMIAWVLYAKCALHLPLDRQRRDFELQGAPISSAMITRWFAEGGDLLRPIVERLRLDLLAGDHVRLDGTGLTVLDFDHKGRPAPRGHVVVFCREDLAVFHYAPTKEGRHVEDFLTRRLPDGSLLAWKGTITADAESAHDRLFGNGDRLETGCNAHGLRKFRDEADKAPLIADTALSFIGRLYDVEADARAAGLAGPSLLEHRQRHAAPVSAEFRAWLDLHIDDLLPSNPVRKAMQYYLNHWDALTRFLSDPAAPIDNNLSERLLRPLAVGRRNWMFAGGANGARRVCDVLSVVETCKLLHVDACDYIAWALTRVVEHPDNRGRKPADLTPAAYKAARDKSLPDEGFA